MKKYFLVPLTFIMFNSYIILSQDTINNIFALQGNVWNTDIINVCWENPGPANNIERGWVQNIVFQSWEANSNIRFTGWGPCNNNGNGIRIQIVSNDTPHTKGLGTQLNGKANGMVLSFDWDGCVNPQSTNRQYCAEVIAVHEFGHALGFSHEHNRPDCICEKDPQGEDGDWFVTPCDINSVMNYCNPEYNGNGQLSLWDIEGIRKIYGPYNPGLLRIIAIKSDGVAYGIESTSADWVILKCNAKEVSLSGIRNGIITNDNTAWVSEGAFGSRWIREMNNVKALSLSGNRIGVITNDNTAWVKEGPLNASWVREMNNVKTLSLSGNRIGVIANDNTAWVKEGPLDATWEREMDNVKALSLSGNRIGVITNDNTAWVKEGSLNASWVREMDDAQSIVLSGNRIGIIKNDNTWIKEGPLNASWVKLAEICKGLSLSGSSIGVMYSDGSTYIKDGAINSLWGVLDRNLKRFALSR